MIVNDTRVQMRGHHNFKPFAPKPLCQFQADQVRLLRRYFSGKEGLIPVEGYDTALLAETSLGHIHSIAGGRWVTVHAAGEILALALPLVRDMLQLIHHAARLGFIHGVFYYIRKGLQVGLLPLGVGGLIGVFGIGNNLVEPPTNRPDCGGGHALLPLRQCERRLYFKKGLPQFIGITGVFIGKEKARAVGAGRNLVHIVADGVELAQQLVVFDGRQGLGNVTAYEQAKISGLGKTRLCDAFAQRLMFGWRKP